MPCSRVPFDGDDAGLAPLAHHDHNAGMNVIRIGGGAGFSGDRIEPAIELAEHGDLDYLIFECLAERTIALAQEARRLDRTGGFDPLLVERMHAVLATCHAKQIKIVTNMGAAHPRAAAACIADVARQEGLSGLRIAAVLGDELTERVRGADLALLESGRRVSEIGGSLVSANAYLGAEPIVNALKQGASVVVTGRVADPSLALAAQMHAFGWSADDWVRLGRGTVVGHLIECAGQITGGYFGDPGYKDVPGLARLGFPIAEVQEDGSAVITKVAGSGGYVTVPTCIEQLLYEIHQPDRYITPDTVADFSNVTLTQLAPDRVQVDGGGGRLRPETLKVSVGYADGFVGEGQISYAGPGAVDRARLAAAIVRERFALTELQPREIRYDLIGVDALQAFEGASVPSEVRLRVVGRTETLDAAQRIGREVESLLTNGPCGGGGASRVARATVAIESTLVPRAWVPTSLVWEQV